MTKSGLRAPHRAHVSVLHTAGERSFFVNVVLRVGRGASDDRSSELKPLARNEEAKPKTKGDLQPPQLHPKPQRRTPKIQVWGQYFSLRLLRY